MIHLSRANWCQAVFALVSVLVGSYYRWNAQAGGNPFNWTRDDPGYYNYLGRAFAAGHLYLPIDPSPQLLAQPDPWDPKVDDSLKLFDAALYNRRYYLYFGAGPAVMLFAPYRFVTGRDLPENFALLLLCFGGFLFSGGALLGILELAGVRPAMPLLAAMLLALGICQCVPFLLSRVWVYEVAAGGGYFCLSAAVFFLVRSLHSPRLWLIAMSGLMFGMALACRPHLVIAGALALVLVAATTSRKRLAAMAIPFLLVGASVAFYNYARFGNPLEFGTKWQLAGENQGRVKLRRANVLPGIYYLVFSKPVFSPVFPWVELSWPPQDIPRPAGYFVEQTVGALYLAPFLIALPLVLFARRNRALLSFLLVSAAGVLLFITLTGWSAQRYEMDFLPLLALAALAAFAEVVVPAARPWRFALCSVLGILIAFGCIVNLALGISGPYWDMIKNKPLRFVRIAGWFSPFQQHRPVLNPRIDISFSTAIRPAPDHFRDEWLTMARYPYRYELYVEHFSGKPKLVSNYAGGLAVVDLASDLTPASFRVTYLPESAEMRVTRNGAEVIRHKIGTLVAAPSQVQVTARPL